jgi:hypothetical protein
VFTAEGRPVLTDLGTARLVGDLARAEVTPAYVDPVVARGGAPGPASDVFGVAAAAFHALTGIAPWNAADPRGTLAVAATGELPDLALLAPEAPEELVAVVRRGLSAEPHQRGSAAAFALDLRHACRPEPVRLPVAGVPDAELGVTGRGPRTELTHQVPGARPRAAHAAAPAAGRLAQLGARLGACFPRSGSPGAGTVIRDAARRAVVVTGVLAAVAAGLAGAAWAGASWGSDPTVPVPAAGTAPASARPGGAATTASETASPAPGGAASPAPETAGGSAPEAAGSSAPAASSAPEAAGSSAPGAAGSSAPEAAGPAPVGSPAVPGADQTTVPADGAGWAAVLDELYRRRAAAFSAGDAAALSAVYPDGALLQRDLAALRTLATAGQTLEGFAPQVRRVLSFRAAAAGTVELRVVDELPGYRVVPTGEPAAPVREVAGRGEAEVWLVLTPTSAGWRISDAWVQP